MSVIGDSYKPIVKSLTGSFKCFKKPVMVKFEVCTEDCHIDTLEGTVKAFKGDYILTGVKGEKWPIRNSTFVKTYKVESKNEASKKMIEVHAVRMNDPFQVKVSWSDSMLNGKPGDFLVHYSEEEYGVVDAEVFLETYEVI